MTTPDNAAAIEFLLRWMPDGPWVLTAIATDRKSINTQTFYPTDLKSVQLWLAEHNGKRNLYFHVNPPMHDIKKKAEREDIKSVDWFHVDIDPRAGEDLGEERIRALGLLTTKLPKGVPEPTVVIFSGGGYQAFWRLTNPIPIDGDLPKADDAKRYNIQLEMMFGADNCHNIDRIMRLPGSINIPDARKRKKGRVETLAELVSFNDLAYSTSEFIKAPELQTETEQIKGGIVVKVSGNIERIDDVSELDQWDVPDRVKVIMVQGSHPDQPKEGDNSRSAWLFDFCCQMVRCGVPDDVIFSIVTDPEWGIAESVVEVKGGGEKYALRQIQRAKESAIDPWLAYFNEKYAVIKQFAGRCLVVNEVFDPVLGTNKLMKMTLPQWEQGYENKFVQVGEDANGNPKWKPAGVWWRKHPQRRQFETIVFAPEVMVPEDCYNMWKGFAVSSIPGECDLFLAHVHDNVCNGDEEHYDYLMKWLGRLVQKPASPGEVAIVLRGGRGVGKSVFANVVGSLFGRHYMQVSNSSHLVGNFNSHLRDLVLMFADEAFYAGDKKHESVLKMLVTEATMPIEAKGVDIETAPNYIHLIMASNDMHVIPAGGDERRFFMLDVAQHHQQDNSYFHKLLAQMDDGGREALLHHLRSIDLEGFNVRRVPSTDALREQKLLSLDQDQEWWYQKLMKGQLLYDGDDWPKEVMSRDLVEDYVEHGRRHHISKRSTETTLGRFLHRALPRISTSRRMAKILVPAGDGWTKEKSIRALFYDIPSLGECREKWEELHGPTDWPQEDAQREMPNTGSSNEPPF